MDYGAIDLHMRHSQIRIIDEDGVVVRDQRVPTTRERLVQVFAGRGPMRILLETGTEGEWVAQALEAAGHTVVVADPNYAPMYGERTRRYLVQQRSGAISLLRALLRQAGYRLGTGSGETVPARVTRLGVTGALADTLAPLCRQIAAVTTEIHALDARLQTRTATDAIVARLRTVPGVGLIVATTFRAFVDRHERFGHAGQVSAAIGLVPREDSSAERRHRGHITKAGPRELRSLLIQAAWVCWRHPGRATLKAWVEGLAARRGKRIAVVALARRLSRILFAVWRDDTTFDVTKIAMA